MDIDGRIWTQRHRHVGMGMDMDMDIWCVSVCVTKSHIPLKLNIK